MNGVQSGSPSSWRLNKMLRPVNSTVMPNNKEQLFSSDQHQILSLESRKSRVKATNGSISSSASTVEFDFSSDTHANYESPDSSCSSSYIAELDDTSDIALQSRKHNSLQTFKFSDECQQTMMQHQVSKIRSLSVGRVVDETIAAIEAVNRELLSRVQAAEESTRILQQQNTDLQITLDQFKRQNLPLKNRCPSASREFSHRPRPSLNIPRNHPAVLLHQKSSSFSASAMRPTDIFDYYDTKPSPSPSPSRNQQENYSGTTPSIPIRISNSNPWDPNCDSPSQKSQPLNTSHQSTQSRMWFMRKNSTEIGLAQGKKTMLTVKTSNPSCADNQPLSSHPISTISSPLPGSVQHHSVLLEGTNLSNQNRPKFISLEEARRRVKNSSPI